jgi:hypothetical protein
MTMTPRLSKFVLTSHITFSVGWVGAVGVFLALAISGVTSNNTQLARAAYLAMELSAWFVTVPLCFASLLTGLVQSLGTKWGLFKHYWIIVKLFLTIAGTILLLLHMQPIQYLAGIAENSQFSNNEAFGLRMRIIGDAGAGLLLLLTITTISVYKPWGKTQYDLLNVQPHTRNGMIISTKKSWKSFVLLGIISLILLFIIMHLLSGGMGHH